MSNRKRNRRPSATRRPASKQTSGRMWWVLGGVALAVLVIAIAASEGNRAPADASVTRDPAAIAAGAELYAANCATCHGVDLNGTETGPPFLNVIYAPNHHADEAFQRAVAGGVQAHHWGFGPMAPVPGLNRGDVALIIKYVRSVQEEQGILRDPSHG